MIVVVGLGYVGLPLSLKLAEHFKVIGFDINKKRIEELVKGIDKNGEITGEVLQKVGKNIKFTNDEKEIKNGEFIIVSVPTPIYADKRPDLRPLESASEVVGRNLKKGAIVVYESTTYPGCTEEYCLPILEKNSRMKHGEFHIGYSPERVNPGDKEHTIDKTYKIISACENETLNRVEQVYSKITKIYRVSSIKTGEAAKVIENIQRDINIALFNELAMLFDVMELDSKEVFDAAATKWNFLRFRPGLVGGHCIPVDPYYLSNRAQELDFFTEVVLAGRKVNEQLPVFIARKIVRLLGKKNLNFKDAEVLILGATYKENVKDLRSSKVGLIIDELKRFGIAKISIYEPLLNEKTVFGVQNKSDNRKYDVVVFAVPHKEFSNMELEKFLKPNGIFADVARKADSKKLLEKGFTYWGL
ncbi:nucleotide sugar dehydrogenase [Candidatus Micrarchaeota archaeon]|nr:nucleotide sugar dehydrogenase [Candidatus Micrarchaeota archaeon]